MPPPRVPPPLTPGTGPYISELYPLGCAPPQVGTVPWMAPELFRGCVEAGGAGARALDVYAFAVSGGHTKHGVIAMACARVRACARA